MIINKKIKYIGQYKIVKTISISGYSDVYLVEDIKDSNKQYALKAIRDMSERYKLQNEINIYKKISKHKNILKLKKIIQASKHCFLLFEYANKLDLEQQIGLNGIFEKEKIFSVLKDMMAILKYAHSLKIMHNDIKPSNIVEKYNTYYLCDWGTAINQEKSETLHIRSDEGYAAPEIFQGKFDYRCDIYSLGCTLYYLATGKKIYDIDDKSTYSYIMYSHCCLDIDVSSIKSQKLKVLILKMTEKNPNERISLKEIEDIIASSGKLVAKERQVNYQYYKDKSCFELYENLLNKKILFAYNNLAFLLEIDEDKKDIQKIIILYEYAAKKGLAKAMYNLAMCFYGSKNIKKDNVNAFYWFRQAALKNHEKAQYYLAEFYEKGLIIKKDMNRAIRLYKISAYAGYNKSYLKLKELHKSDK